MSVMDSEGLFQSQPGLKTDPSFRQEDQEMAQELKPIVVSPPGYASPDPTTAAGRLLPVEQTVVPISEDYGANVLDGPGMEANVATHAPESTLTPEQELRANAKAESAELPEDRATWTKANYQTHARALGLAENGNKDALVKRVEDAEKDIKAAKELSAEDWKSAVDDADDADELADLRRVYALAEVDYSTVESAFDAKQAEFDAPAPDADDNKS
jgi:hypothetical protein